MYDFPEFVNGSFTQAKSTWHRQENIGSKLEITNLFSEICCPYLVHSNAYFCSLSVSHRFYVSHRPVSTHFMATRSTSSRFGCYDWSVNATIN